VGKLQKLYLIRHGLSVANVEGLVCGQMDAPLSERGIAEVAEIAKSHAIHSLGSLPCFSSPLQRATKTAELLGFKNWELVPDLMETNTGNYSTLKFAEFNEQYPEFKHHQTNFDARYPEGESTGQMIARAWSAFQTIEKKTEAEAIVIVAHSGPLNAIANHLLGIPFDSFPNLRFEHGKATLLRKPLPHSKYWCLESFNVG
jgi:alpha-ribazole phosphatase